MGVTEHVGDNYQSGHYVRYSYHYRTQKWYRCSDQDVEEVSWATVRDKTKQSATSLTYMRMSKSESVTELSLPSIRFAEGSAAGPINPVDPDAVFRSAIEEYHSSNQRMEVDTPSNEDMDVDQHGIIL